MLYTNYDFYSNPTDTLTLIPFLKRHKLCYGQMPQVVVADAGYGSEENYEFTKISFITENKPYFSLREKAKRLLFLNSLKLFCVEAERNVASS